jgi:hypothetical protein
MYQILIIFLTLSYVSANYDAAMGRDFWYYATASYCRPSKIQNWNCDWACKAPKISDVIIFYNSTGDNSGFAGYNVARN